MACGALAGAAVGRRRRAPVKRRTCAAIGVRCPPMLTAVRRKTNDGPIFERILSWSQSIATLSLGRGAVVLSAIFVLAHSTAQSAPNRCGELKPLAAKVSSENELVQEEHRPGGGVGGDPNWCMRARAMTQAMTNMIQIIEADSNRCHVSEDKIQALQKSAHRATQLSEGCP